MTLEQVVNQSNGVLKTAEALRAGASKEQVYAYIKANNFEKIAQGIYLAQDAWADEMYLLQLRFPKAVFSHEAALYLHDLAEREPVPLSVTVPAKYNATGMTDKAKVYYVKPEWYAIGVCEVQSPYGNPLKVYDKERTICDIIRKRADMDAAAFNYAVNRYVKSKDKDYALLMQYAKTFRMEKKLRTVMGVLF